MSKYYVYNAEVLVLIEELRAAPVKRQPYLKGVLVNKLLYMVCAKIKRHHGKFFYEDLLQEGKIALLKAIDDFDAERGLNFFKFATWHIQSRLRKFFHWYYKIPMTSKEITEEVENADFVLDPQEMFEALEARTIVNDAVYLLNDVDKRVLIMRYGLEEEEENTFEQIGNKMALSKQRIEQIKNRALDRLQKNVHIKNYLEV